MKKGKRLTKNQKFLRELLLLYSFLIVGMGAVGFVMVKAISGRDVFLAVVGVFAYLLVKDYSEFLSGWIKRNEPARPTAPPVAPPSFRRDFSGMSPNGPDLPLSGEVKTK